MDHFFHSDAFLQISAGCADSSLAGVPTVTDIGGAPIIAWIICVYASGRLNIVASNEVFVNRSNKAHFMSQFYRPLLESRSATLAMVGSVNRTYSFHVFFSENKRGEQGKHKQ